ncbi:response regulator [Paenisporosarcina cavernae]|uniref:Response regulator n=1 Tax=Paenisporosarcina cavernae TaxID=2320858 RepID=A0A385YRX4_9BACL|nr:response regulator [Paenisporosarcina cavernae]AYC29499.1 response regulator [Paenisporosarcina cavernae]
MPTVIICDDALFMRAALRKMLEELGFTVVAEAKNGKEAIDYYRTFQPTVVTMDITMPGISGLETLNRLKEEFPDAAVVMVSALGQQKTLQQAIEFGAKDFVTKPFQIHQLKNVFHSYLSE